MRLEYVGATRGSFGQRYAHRLLLDGNEIENDASFVAGLKSVEQLEKEAISLGGAKPRNLASQNGHLAGTSQAEICEVLSPSHEGNGRRNPNLAANGGRHIYVLRNEATRNHKGAEVKA